MDRKDNAPLDVSGQTKDISSIPFADIEKLKKLLKKAKYYFYVILLGRDDDEFIKNFVIENWKNLHFMSGENILFLSIYKPDKIDDEVKQDLKKRFGELFDNTEPITPAPAWSYKYARLLGISYDNLPCLFIGTDIERDKGIVVKIPKLKEKYLREFFKFLFKELNELADLDEDKRLERLKESLNKYMLEKLKLKSEEIFIEYILPKINTEQIISQLIAIMISLMRKAILA